MPIMKIRKNLDGVFNVRKYVQDRWRSPENPGNGIVPRTKSGLQSYSVWGIVDKCMTLHIWRSKCYFGVYDSIYS